MSSKNHLGDKRRPISELKSTLKMVQQAQIQGIPPCCLLAWCFRRRPTSMDINSAKILKFITTVYLSSWLVHCREFTKFESKMSTGEAQKKKAAPPAHPLYKDMIIAAITTLKDRKGASRQAIVKHVVANYKVGDNAGKLINNGLKKGIAAGVFELSKDSRGRFKLSEATKTATKKPAKKPVKKPVAKKPAAAKTAKPKKPAAKTTKKTTKPATKKAAKSPAKKAKSPAKPKTKKPTGKATTKKAGAKKATPKKGVKKPAAKRATKGAKK